VTVVGRGKSEIDRDETDIVKQGESETYQKKRSLICNKDEVGH